MSDNKPQAPEPEESKPHETDSHEPDSHEPDLREPVTPLETAAEEEPSTFKRVDDAERSSYDAEPVAAVEKEPVEEVSAREVPVEEVPADVSSTEPVRATDDPAAVEYQPVPAVAPVQTVYVAAPNPPRRRGNRGFGVLIALAATVIFVVLFAVAEFFIRTLRTGESSFSFLSQQTFYVPVLFFLVGFILLVLIANRSSWWAYILGSLFVGLFVYFGTVGTFLLTGGALAQTPDQAAASFNELLTDPYIITAALLAREVTLWAGSGIGARGRRVRQRNADARAAYERESAERQAAYGRDYRGDEVVA